MPAPQVSIILNAMNGDRFIAETITSILNQTFKNFELIIIDDGSTDLTWDVIQSFTDPRIHAFKQENHGIAATVNRGIARACAPYLARIDQDDLMRPERLERQKAYLDAHPAVALCCSAAQLMFDRTLSDKAYRPEDGNALKLRLLFENPVVQCTVMMRTAAVKALGGYDEDPSLHPADDFEMWTRIARHHEIKALPELLAIYRIHRTSASYSIRTIKHNVTIGARSLHLYLSGRYSLIQCESLAAIYHRWVGEIAPLPLRTALAMFDAASLMIAPDRARWSAEFKAAYAMQRRMIFFHSLLRRPGLRTLVQPVPALRLRH